MTYKTITLLDRLKPHYSEKLSDKNIQHPTVVGRIIDVLESNNFVLDLRYSAVLDLYFVLGSKDPFVYFKDL
jgi:hypothetical protein|tara:strand:- start:2382 stop:2597 length:216 start_codon:yes stop_codon:yes gene_type:complete